MQVAPNHQTRNLDHLAMSNDKKSSVRHLRGEPENQASKAQDASVKLSSDFNSFIKLLITQLKHQDPSGPMNTNEMTQQIVAFTGVGQAVETNKNLEKLLELNEGVKFTNASNLIGKEVVYDSSFSELDAGGKANFGYILDAEPDQIITSTKIKILNSENVIVRILDGEKKAGNHILNWDGLDINHKPAPKDKYTIKVDSVDEKGASVKVGNTEKSGIVSEAEIGNGTVIVTVNGVKIPISRVKSFKDNLNMANANLSKKTIEQIGEMMAKKASIPASE